MSKIICDVCGTSYPETANQCPICGCVRPGDAVTVRGDTNEAEVSSANNYTYVKGGRFSKSNVKKRNQGKAVPAAAAPSQKEEKPKKEGKGDKVLIVTVFLLLLAIVAIVIYIALHFFAPGQTQDDKNPADNTTESTAQTVETTEATVLEIPCVSLDVSDTVIELDKAGAALLLNVTAEPADTTDEITYATSDEAVAVVTDDGKVVAVGNGQATITVTCGTVAVECRVVCTIEEETTGSTEATYSTEDFKFNREDFTMGTQGATWTLYSGDIPVELITWSSDDEKVATISNGVVTAVGGGYTTVYGEYGDVKLSCIVRCSFTAKAPEETQAPATAAYKISDTDVTIKVGESFSLTLTDENGEKVSASWISANSGICTVSNGIVTGVAAGQTTVSVTIDGVTYSCIVRVSK